MFAVLALEREPMQWAELPAALKTWTQGAGGLAAFGLLICFIAYKTSAERQRVWRGIFPMLRGETWSLAAVLFAGASVAAALCYALLLLILAASKAEIPLGEWAGPAVSTLLMVGGACAIAAVLVPILAEVARFRLGRIWGLARLSFKEAVRNHVLWAICSVMALIFLFAAWFISSKPEDQLRSYVLLIYLLLTILFVLVACWLGSFGITTEVKNQSIHTIVTKPVERFEIVLGRFLGYGILLSAALFALAGISLGYLWRGVRDEAKKESFTARVPVYADHLSFYGTKDAHIGENVGRVWDYRSYIGGPNPALPNAPRQYAIWSFERLPGGGSEPVKFEFTFDIYRLTKGREDRGVDANFTFADGSLSVDQVETRLKQLKDEELSRKAKVVQDADAKLKQGETPRAVSAWRSTQQERLTSDLMAKYGIYAVAMEVLDYHTQTLGGDDPEQRERIGRDLGQLFHSLREPEKKGFRQSEESAPPALKVLVSLDLQHASAAQKLGVAKRDLYVLADTGPFWLNFLKGFIGVWFTVMLILGIAVACSTYFSGIISLLVTLFLLLFGLCKDSFLELVQGKGGGPLESAYRLFTKSPGAVRLDESPTASLLRGGDEVYRFFVRLIVNVFPDINRHDLHPYVANGFDISWSQVLLLDNFMPLAGYTLPCAILAFYLMKFREVANPT